VLTGHHVAAVTGTERLEKVHLAGPDGVDTVVDAAGMFIFIGARPRTDWLADAVVTDDHGFVVTGAALRPDRWGLDRDPFLLETSMPGVFAVGDLRATSVKRVASAVGEGSVAVQFVTRCCAAPDLRGVRASPTDARAVSSMRWPPPAGCARRPDSRRREPSTQIRTASGQQGFQLVRQRQQPTAGRG
jgi:hypothetical protein